MAYAAQFGGTSDDGATPSAFSPLRLPVAVAIGCCLVLALTAGKGLYVWQTGAFLDPDDAMRAVEVRDFLAGQGWFDMVQHRMAPGHEVPMHWSRLADLPLAAGISLLSMVTRYDLAERLVRLLQPVLCLVVFMTAAARLGRDLLGRWGGLSAAVLCACCLETVGVFVPGHIHHHALQVTLLMVLGTVTVAAMADRQGRVVRFAWVGALAAISLAVNLQNLPFILVSIAALGVGWIGCGGPFVRPLRSLSGALMGGTGIVFVLQVPSDRYFASTCDAFGAPHLLAVWLSGAGLLVLSAASDHLTTPVRRCVAAGVLASFLLIALWACYPDCLGDPYAGVDPLLKSRWLDEVGEAMPLTVLLHRDPAGSIPIVAALATGLSLIGIAAWRSDGPRRVAWLVVGGFALVGLAGAVWEVRVAGSAEPFAAFGVAWALCRWFDPARPRKPLAALLCVTSGLALTQAGWAAALPAAMSLVHREPTADHRTARVDAAACFAPAAYAELATLPPGLVLSTIDPGPQILAYTPHAVLAAPYHRNTYGNRISLKAFDAPPDAARPIVLASGATYVAICVTSPEIVEEQRQRPEGLAARLAAGTVPNWLRWIGDTEGPVRVFEVVRSSLG